MNIDSIQNGIVIDHITAGLGMKLYELLDLASLDASIALIKNVCYNYGSKRTGVYYEGYYKCFKIKGNSL